MPASAPKDVYIARVSVVIAAPALVDKHTARAPAMFVVRRRTTAITAVTGDVIIFVNELSANVEADHHEHNINTLGNTSWMFDPLIVTGEHRMKESGFGEDL